MAEKKMPKGYSDGGSADEELIKKFPSNSKFSKGDPPLEEPDKKVTKVVKGPVMRKKKGFLTKVSEVFIKEDADNIGSYIFNDVLVPALQDMISDMIIGGIEMLFGTRKNTRSYRDRNVTHVNYGSFSDDRRNVSKVSRARHSFDDIVLKDRGEAEEVISNLVDLTIDYGVATVADLYDLVGVRADFTDAKYGWTDLSTARTRRVQGGYFLDLPKTRLID